MATYRSIHKEFWADEKMSKIPMEARLFFIGTWSLADDGGIIRSNPAYLKNSIFPYEERLSVTKVAEWIDYLVEGKHMIPFVHNHESYLLIRTWLTYQKIDKRYYKALLSLEEIANLLQQPEAQPPREPGGNPRDFGGNSREPATKVNKSVSKVNDSRVNVREQVTLHPHEIEKLKTDHGEEAYEWMVDKLNNHKISSGKKYKDDYRAILSWVVDAFNEKKIKATPYSGAAPSKNNNRNELERLSEGIDRLRSASQ